MTSDSVTVSEGATIDAEGTLTLAEESEVVDSSDRTISSSENAEKATNKGNDKIWHTLTDNFDNPSSKNGWGKIKKKFWKDYAKQVVNGGI